MEEPVNDHTGKVDVSLLRDDLRIACEVSVTNTVEYEVQNILKCFKAGFTLVFMISNDQKHLTNIRSLAVNTIDELLQKRLYFVSKEDFSSQLDLLLVQKEQPSEIRAKGYRVKVKYIPGMESSSQQKALNDIVLSSLRKNDK